MRDTIDLNCDVGEICWERDAQLLPFVSSCNVSCGAHAGDLSLITGTVREALRLGVAIGAHPSYPDRKNFGRMSMSMSAEHLLREVLDQCDLLRGIVRSLGGHLQHIKPHGALYHDLVQQPKLAEAILAGVSKAFPKCAVFGLAGSALAGVCQGLGLRFVAEGFADRRYASATTLVPRSQSDATLEDTIEFQEHFDRLLRGEILDTQNRLNQVSIETICLHSDTPHASALSQLAYTRLKAAHVRLAPPVL
ncbi:MAG: LamB/YcsF family protein [Planctomycetales bacterium]|nr:LamB/YcsF family protein [Planctomycetales bacterium]